MRACPSLGKQITPPPQWLNPPVAASCWRRWKDLVVEDLVADQEEVEEQEDQEDDAAAVDASA